MIEIRGLTKRFEKVVAVNRLDLTVREGTVTGLVGSNGSGKSTLLRMLAGVFRGEEGTILLDGTVPTEDIFPLLDLSFELTMKKRKRK